MTPRYLDAELSIRPNPRPYTQIRTQIRSFVLENTDSISAFDIFHTISHTRTSPPPSGPPKIKIRQNNTSDITSSLLFAPSMQCLQLMYMVFKFKRTFPPVPPSPRSAATKPVMLCDTDSGRTRAPGVFCLVNRSALPARVRKHFFCATMSCTTLRW